jgi:hypothetical protein
LKKRTLKPPVTYTRLSLYWKTKSRWNVSEGVVTVPKVTSDILQGSTASPSRTKLRGIQGTRRSRSSYDDSQSSYPLKQGYFHAFHLLFGRRSTCQDEASMGPPRSTATIGEALAIDTMRERNINIIPLEIPEPQKTMLKHTNHGNGSSKMNVWYDDCTLVENKTLEYPWWIR